MITLASSSIAAIANMPMTVIIIIIIGDSQQQRKWRPFGRPAAGDELAAACHPG
jgi:hypothetical protein